MTHAYCLDTLPGLTIIFNRFFLRPVLRLMSNVSGIVPGENRDAAFVDGCDRWQGPGASIVFPLGAGPERSLPCFLLRSLNLNNFLISRSVFNAQRRNPKPLTVVLNIGYRAIGSRLGNWLPCGIDGWRARPS